MADSLKAQMDRLAMPEEKGIGPTNQKQQSRKARTSRELLGTSEFADNHMSMRDDTDSERGDPSPDPYRASITSAPKVELRKDVKVKEIGGEVTINQQNLGEADVPAIVSLLAQEGRVQKLILSDDGLGDAEVTAIAKQLETNTSLTYLSLHKNKISGGKDGGALAQALQNGCPNLTTLFMTQNPLTDEAMLALTQANAARSKPLSGLNGLVL